MTNDIYVKLTERLNQFESKVPPVASFYELLEELYTPEEANLAIKFPEGSFTSGELADALKKDEAELAEFLEIMANNGQVFVVKTEAGDNKYELAPWMPGVIEFTIIRRMDTPKIKTILKLVEAMAKEARALAEPLMGDIDALKAMLPDPHVRTLPIDEALPDKREVYPYENLLEIIEKEESFAAMRCCCRHMAEYRDDPCHVDGIPEYSCLGFGVVADFIVDREFGKRITKEECKEILETCSKAGLVHNTNNFIEGMQFVCNCCSCCCGFIRQVKEVGNLNIINASNFVSVVAEESCTGCGDCVERCPVEAISLKDDVAFVDQDVCIGCGNCVTVCPSGSLSMNRVSDEKPELGDRKIGLGY